MKTRKQYVFDYCEDTETEVFLLSDHDGREYSIFSKGAKANEVSLYINQGQLNDLFLKIAKHYRGGESDESK